MYFSYCYKRSIMTLLRSKCLYHQLDNKNIHLNTLLSGLAFHVLALLRYCRRRINKQGHVQGVPKKRLPFEVKH